jgi:hypothetical protein
MTDWELAAAAGMNGDRIDPRPLQPTEAVCSVCRLAHNINLADCPNCKDLT